MIKLLRRASIVFLLSLSSLPAQADVIDQIAARGSINLGYRIDAAPFSFLDATNRAAGFSIDLCLRITDDISKLVKKPIKTRFVVVDSSDRFDALANGTIDLLCGADTVSLSRREQVDFTLFTFVTGGTFMIRAKPGETGPVVFDRKVKVGVLTGTTSEKALQQLVDSGKLDVEIVPVDTHDVAIGLLNSGVLDSYFGDRELLWDRRMHAADPSAFAISDELLSYEPYALALKRGENRLRLISDRTLSELYRSGDIYQTIERWFPNGKPSKLLSAIYFLQSLSD
jgi:polar amino acid transport system substrate-binding protein/glutamate/aspartate transport system substrate-binding protein